MASTQVTTRILRRLLASGVISRAERLLLRMHPADLAPLLGALQPEEIRTVVDLLFRHRRAARTLRELPIEMVPQIFEVLSDERIAQVIARLEVDDMLELIEAIPEERRDAVVALIPESRREELRKVQLYPESSAGRVMTTRFVAVEEKLTAQQAIDRIREIGDEAESVLYLYVVDDQRRLLGVVPIRRLVSARPDRPCGELMIREPVSVRADADQEEAAHLVARYNLLAIPVTEADGRLLGIITVDDVIEVITEEATEDIYHLAGLSEDDRVFSPARQSIRKRLPWMLLNLGTAFTAAWVVGLFERTLDQFVTLAIFLPVVAAMGGNGGIQALTVITRAIALEEIEFSSGLRAAGKELVVGITIGAVTGVASGFIVYAWRGNPYLGLVLFLAMMISMAIAGLLGAAVPLLLKGLRQDPALGSGVIVTTTTDIVGFFTFLTIGTRMMDYLA
ncbi:MAG: magnesium transporter [Deltaproteobacteria bacterium]|nr:MAG: magnesium transporter [Deltaproteobacteria bacterium]